LNRRYVLLSGRQVPQYVQGHGGTGTCQRVHLRGIGKLLLNRRRRAALHELPKPGPGVGKSPRRHFNPEAVERAPDSLRIPLCCACTVSRHLLLSGLSELEIYSLLKRQATSVRKAPSLEGKPS